MTEFLVYDVKAAVLVAVFYLFYRLLLAHETLHRLNRLVLLGRITYVGRTSCEIRVDSFIEDKDGFRHIINRAFLTYVAIDEKGNPLQIPYGLEVKTVAEKARWDGALLRRGNRKSRKNIGF